MPRSVQRLLYSFDMIMKVMPLHKLTSNMCSCRCLVIEPADRFTAHQLLNETEFLRGSGVAAGISSNTATSSSAAVIASSNNIGPSTSNAL